MKTCRLPAWREVLCLDEQHCGLLVALDVYMDDEGLSSLAAKTMFEILASITNDLRSLPSRDLYFICRAVMRMRFLL